MARSRRFGLQRWLALGLAGLAVLVMLAAFLWRDDIMQVSLDPQEPFQTYDPPPAPDYDQESAWALRPTPNPRVPSGLSADVFFVTATGYDGGHDWNAPIDDAEADRFFRRTVAPNYAGPFVRVGRIFAPRYRQASLYTLLTLREDAREARRFAYGDVAEAFRWYLKHANGGRPFFLVGVEQGGTLAAHLLAEAIAPDPALRERLVAAYLIETVIPAEATPIPPCRRREEAGCLAAWATAVSGDLDRPHDLRNRSLVWDGGQLADLRGRTPLCFNPILGAVTDQPGPARLNLGAVNATGLEWGARPAFMARQVKAQCDRGVLMISRPRSVSLQPSGAWAERKKVPGFNYFYADLEVDATARREAWAAAAVRQAVCRDHPELCPAEPPPGRGDVSLRPSRPAASRTAPAAASALSPAR